MLRTGQGAGSNSAARNAMIATTTSNSSSVNALHETFRFMN